MPEIDTRPFRPLNNIDIINAIRNANTTDFQRRVPAATKANIDSVIDNILDYRPNVNEFVDALVNLIGLQIVKGTLWTNPWAKFKIGMLSYGDTIEEINVGLLKAKRYDPDREYLEKDLFGQERPDIQSSFHRIDRQDFYKLSINNTLLRRAFMQEYGLSSFIAKLMSSPTTSDQWDEFLITASLFKTYDDAGGFFKVNVPDISASTSNEADAKYALRRMREMAGNLQFLSTHYNASGMPVAAQPDELELFVTPEANAAMDVEALAGAFNIDRAKFDTRVNIVPSEHFNIPGAQAVLTTRDFFVIADTLIDTANVVNPIGLHTNYIFHHHQIVSASRFVPAILFTTEPGDVIVINETPVTGVSDIVVTEAETGVAVTTDVSRGGLYLVESHATTTPVDGVNDAVSYSLTGTQSPRTRITQTGTLYVAYDEASETITVVATPEDSQDSSLVKTLDLTVVGDLLDLWPNPEVIPDSDNDGLLEVTPEEPTFVDNTITIPSVTGVQYKNGAVNVNNASQIVVANGTPVTITAVARAGYELATGATATWTFTFA